MKNTKRLLFFPVALAMLIIPGANCIRLYAQAPRAKATTSKTAPVVNESPTFTSGSMVVSGGTSNNITTWGSGGSGATIAMLPNGTVQFLSGSNEETRKPMKPMPTIQQVRLFTKAVAPLSMKAAAYLKLASSLELKSAATDELVVMGAIDDTDLKVYDFEKVDEYLYNQALKMGSNVRWVWKPMRQKDQKNTETVSRWSMQPGVGMLSGNIYTHAIPARVLEHVSELAAKIPDAVFLISDYEVVKPDPFLAVTTDALLRDGKIYIVDQWDEPTFDEGKAPLVELVPSPVI